MMLLPIRRKMESDFSGDGIFMSQKLRRLQVHQKVLSQRLFPDKIILKEYNVADSELEYNIFTFTTG